MGEGVTFVIVTDHRNTELGKYRVMTGEVFRMILVTLYSSFSDIHRVLFRYQKAINIRGVNAITMVKGRSWTRDLKQI